MSKNAFHYTKIGDAGGVPLQRCEPSEFGSAHYTKIGDGVFAVVDFGPAWVAAHVER